MFPMMADGTASVWQLDLFNAACAAGSSAPSHSPSAGETGRVDKDIYLDRRNSWQGQV